MNRRRIKKFDDGKTQDLTPLFAPEVKMPSGREIGAHPGYWMPGGYTSNGVPEAVIPQPLRVEQVVVKSVKELFNDK